MIARKKTRLQLLASESICDWQSQKQDTQSFGICKDFLVTVDLCQITHMRLVAVVYNTTS